MRGLPGSGKSTWVQRFGDIPRFVCSADDFHVDERGTYRYDPKNAGKAHDWCLKKYLGTLQSGFLGNVIVDNTNVSLVEIAPYARLAQALCIPFKIVYVYCDPVVAYSRNLHGVPFSTILKMQRILLTEEVPSWWPQEIIVGCAGS